MRTLYLRKEENESVRKILIDMAYLVSNKKIRMPKYQFEDNLYLLFIPNPKNDGEIQKYYLTKDKLLKEDNNHYYFDFPFKADQVEKVAE